MRRFAEEVGDFEKRAHGRGELRGGGQDDAEEFLRRAAVRRLAFSPTVKGLRSAEEYPRSDNQLVSRFTDLHDRSYPNRKIEGVLSGKQA